VASPAVALPFTGEARLPVVGGALVLSSLCLLDERFERRDLDREELDFDRDCDLTL